MLLIKGWVPVLGLILMNVHRLERVPKHMPDRLVPEHVLGLNKILFFQRQIFGKKLFVLFLCSSCFQNSMRHSLVRCG